MTRDEIWEIVQGECSCYVGEAGLVEVCARCVLIRQYNDLWRSGILKEG